MKLAVTLAVLAVTGCATAVDSESSTADPAIVLPAGLPSTNTTCQWLIDRNCYGQLNDGNNLWPTGMGINSAYLLMRSGPTRLAGKQPTFLAFVVWNDSVVGRIFRVDVGTRDGANFLAVANATFTNRTLATVDSGLPDPSWGATGSLGGGGPPPPRPNVDDLIVFDPVYLNTVTTNAAIIRKATAEFMGAKTAF